MKKTFPLGFLVSVIACGVILNALPIDDTKYALYKLGGLVDNDIQLKEQLAQNCSQVNAPFHSPIEDFLAKRLPTNQTAGEKKSCTVIAHAAKATRFRLRSFWNFQIQIRTEAGSVINEQAYFVEFPRPLVLLPIAVFLLALVFQFGSWSIGWTVATYALLLCGGNLIATFHALARSTQMAFAGEQPWIGLFLILIWVALFRGRTLKSSATNPSRKETLVNRALFSTIALWNPTALTLASRLLVPFRGAIQRLQPFFTLQVTAVALSAYLLSLDPTHLGKFFSGSLFLPRYFTFALLLFLCLELKVPRFEPLIWKLPGLGWAFISILLLETLAATTPYLEGTSTLTRVGLCLVLTELFSRAPRNWKRVQNETLRASGALLICAVLSEFTSFMGITDLALRLFDPRMHPSAAVLFTFLCSMTLGFLSGSFALAYFALSTVLFKTGEVSILRAALLDGSIAGILLSPFSVLNWLPAKQLGLDLGQIIVHRFRLLAAPLLLGIVIYAVSAINSVAILMPATFCFLCLVAIALRLRKSAWKLGGYTISQDLRSAKH